VTEEWKKLLQNLYLSPGYVTRIGQRRKVYKVLVGKLKGKRPLGRQRRRRENGIRMYVRETDGAVNWIRLPQDSDRWRAIVISRCIYIDTSLSNNIYVSMDIYRYISTG
jgi:hypothetical protein